MMRMWFLVARAALDIVVLLMVGACGIVLLVLAIMAISAGLRALLW